MNSSVSGPVPRCARGHSATYDPGSKTLFVYGGLREGQRYSELYVLNTLTWKWKLITVGLFRVINVFAVFFSYRVEVFNMFFVLFLHQNVGKRKCSKCGVSLRCLL